ncbi:hypothetical protein D3C76_1694960 [compost metagenome]
MQMDKVNLRDAALVAAEDAGLTEIRPVVSGLQDTPRESPRAVIQHKVNVALLDKRVSHKWEAAVIVRRKNIAATVQRFTTLHHLKRCS